MDNEKLILIVDKAKEIEKRISQKEAYVYLLTTLEIEIMEAKNERNKRSYCK